ncbi:MAG: leucyl aminopeptidase [Actinomycetota bacterium]|nr:leucyl aminopeptidase [Actinomycetota bacterium]
MTEIVPSGALSASTADLLIVPVFADLTWGPGAESTADQLGPWLADYLETREFTGAAGQLVVVPGGALSFGSVAFVGLGDEVDAESLRRAAGTVGRMSAPYPSTATTLHLVDVEGAIGAVALGYLLGAYRFDAYRSEPKPRSNERLELLEAGEGAGAEIRDAAAIARGVALARDLINQPAVDKSPEVLAGRARSLSDSISVEIVDEVEAAERGYGGLLAVGAGATNPPRMVIMSYGPADAGAFVAFVGKGIVFDSGGLSLKTAKGMEDMKTDMAGAAAVYGAMQAIAELELPVRVLGVTPLSENMTGGSAQRPGDVFTAYNGKTVEVLNTDAEGRLVLADGLGIAAEAGPDMIVDIATLTGAAKVALGPTVGAIFGNDDGAIAAVEAAARFAGESMWTMPFERSYRSLLDSPIADLKNIGDQWGGAITAALFLSEFVDDRPWVHLDIAGPGRADKTEHYLLKGATGFTVRTLVELARKMAGAVEQ